MSMFGQMRNEYFKYRKRKKRSLDGSVPGADYNHFHRPTTPALGSTRKGGNYLHKLYLDDLPDEYRPNIHTPAAQSREYEDMDTLGFPVNGTTSDERRHPSFESSAAPVGFISTVQDDLSLVEQFLMNIGVRPRPQEGSIDVESDAIRHLLDGVRGTIHTEDIPEPETVPSIADINNALNVLQDVLPDDHPDMINLRNALQIISGQGINTQHSIETVSGHETFEYDPVAEAQQIFDRQMQHLNETFELPALFETENHANTVFEEQLAALDQVMEQAQPDMPFTEQNSLEHIIEADSFNTVEQPFRETIATDDIGMLPDMPTVNGYDMPMIHDEINQAIDQVSGQPMHEPISEQQPNPGYDPMMEDPWQIHQAMYDSYMQQMMNPYMMPNQMGFGPMGPMPGGM